jgi:hypothetical protein
LEGSIHIVIRGKMIQFKMTSQEKNKILKEKMSLEEFKRKCEKEDYNVVEEWDKEHFKIVCSKCGSDNTIFFFRTESGRMGSEYTGYMRGFNHDEGAIIKCIDCGNAMNIGLPAY